MTHQSALSRILETSPTAFIPGALDGNNWNKEARRVIETTRRLWGLP